MNTYVYSVVRGISDHGRHGGILQPPLICSLPKKIYDILTHSPNTPLCVAYNVMEGPLPITELEDEIQNR